MGQTTIDLFDRFTAASSAGDQWRVANEVLADLGGCAVNVGEVDTRTLGPLWLHSSMSGSWLSEYVEQAYFNVDPYILGISDAQYPHSLLAGVLERDAVATQKELDLNWGLKDAGYRFLHAQRFVGRGAGSAKVVTFCTDIHHREFSPEDFQRINQAQMAIAAFVSDADVDGGQRIIQNGILPQLTSREAQVMTLLANGLQNAAIAHDLDIAEVTVRKTLISARKKLRAKTREEALAIAVRAGLLGL